MNSTSKGIATIWLIIAGFVLIAGSGFWFWVDDIKPYLEQKNYYYSDGLCGHQPPAFCQYGTGLKCNEKTKKWECASVSNSDSEHNDTSDWKTYRNEKYGFLVKYPQNAKISEKFFPGIGYFAGSLELKINVANYEYFTLVITHTNMTLDNYIDLTISENSKDIKYYAERKKINGIDGFDIYGEALNEFPHKTPRIFTNSFVFTKNDALWSLELDPVLENKISLIDYFRGDTSLGYQYAEKKDIAIYRSILSTFRFLE